MSLPTPSFRRNAPWALVAACLGLALFLWRFDPAIVAPRNVDRLLAAGGDPAMNALGWEYFRSEPWSWPPGRCERYGAPFGSSIGLVDGIPLLGLPGKLLGGGRTAPWQYFGLWLLAAYLLQGFVSWLAVGLVLHNPVPRLLATALLLLTPSFLTRTGHAALSAHWLVLLALVLYGRRARPAAWLALVAVATFCHPYLTAMVLALAAAHLLRTWRSNGAVGLPQVLALLGAMAVLVAAGWWLSGMFVYGLGANDHVAGYGQFSANLNTLVNPGLSSRLLPPLSLAGAQQVEGFNYLGLGLLPLWLLAVVRSIQDGAVRQCLRAHGPLLLILATLAVFAVSLRVTLGEWQVLRTDVPGFLTPLTSAFRASGRFLWPMTYAGSLFAFWTLRRTVGFRAQTALLAGLLVLQVVDLGPMLGRRAHFRSGRFNTRLVHPAWPAVLAATERLLTVPPLEAGTQFPYDFRDLDVPLVGRGVPTSAAYLTRSNAAHTRQWLAEFLAEAAAGRRPAPGTTVIVRDTALITCLAALAPDFTACNLDGFQVFMHRSLVPPGCLTYGPPRIVDLAAFLAENRGRTLALAAKDEATLQLGEQVRAMLRARGLDVDRLEYRCSFAGVLAPSGTLWQEVRTDQAVRHTVDGPRRLELLSAGLLHGDQVSLRLDGIEHAVSRRGLNILVLDEQWQPLALGLFDTFLGDSGCSLDYRRSAE